MTKKQNLLMVLLLSAISLGSAAAWFGTALLLGAYWYLSPSLPTVDILKDVRMQQPLRVYTREGKLLAEFGQKRRIPISIDQVPERLKQAFLAAEDDRFEVHPGVDYRGIIRAGLNQVLKGDRSQGGSTITMQVARNFFLTREKTYTRKLSEIFLALKIERELSKDKILELYLNKIYLGKRAYGVAAAAQVYYGKTLDQISLPEVAMIAGLPKAPSAFNPIINPDRALTRRNYVLGRMLELNYISPAEHQLAIKAPITAGTHEVAVEAEAPYVAEMVRAEMVERYGEEVYVSGMKVHTTVDVELQLAAQRAIRNGLSAYTERHGFRGPIRRLVELPEGIELIQIESEETAVEDDADSPATVAVTEDQQFESNTGMIDRGDDVETELAAAEQAAVGDVALQLDEAQIHTLPQAEVDQQLEEIGYIGNVRPGLIVQFIEPEEDEEAEQAEQESKEEDEEQLPKTRAVLYLGDGEYTEIDFAGLQWARSYVSVNELGPELKAMQDVVQLGDFVWLRSNAEQVMQMTQVPNVEGALSAIDPDTGALLALVGGFDFYNSKFNRATQARRQPGSGFKPFVYATALNEGYTAASIINDAPVVFDDPALEGKWRPENYSGRFFGPTRLREGLVKSRNLVSIRLLIALGIKRVRRYAKALGFDDEVLPRDLSLALGSGTISPLQLSVAYAIFANGGFRVNPYFIDSIEDATGNTIWMADYELACLQCFVDKRDPLLLERQYEVQWPEDESAEQQADAEVIETVDVPPTVDNDIAAAEEPLELDGGDIESEAAPEPIKRILRQAPRVMDEKVNYIINSMLRDVVLRGTGRKARQLGRNDLAGKTGTSNDEHDAWFNGFNHKYVASVWVGFDKHQPLGRGEAGGAAALPIWIEFMREALQDVEEQPLQEPEGLVTMRIDAKSGLLASVATVEDRFEIFRVENVPTEQVDDTVEIDLYEEVAIEPENNDIPVDGKVTEEVRDVVEEESETELF